MVKRRRLQRRKVLAITILCGAVISGSFYLIGDPFDWPSGREQSILSPLLPFYILSLLNVVPRIFVARILLEGFRLPEWLGEIIGVLYWPSIGAIVGASKRWVLWGVAVLVVHVVLLGIVFYVLSKEGIMF